jgi:hypothetical protein
VKRCATESSFLAHGGSAILKAETLNYVGVVTGLSLAPASTFSNVPAVFLVPGFARIFTLYALADGIRPIIGLNGNLAREKLPA